MRESLRAFDLSSLTQHQRSLIENAVDRCDFDFRLLLPRLKAEGDRLAIPVLFEDLTSFGARARASGGDAHSHSGAYHVIAWRNQVLGLAYYSGKVVIHSSLSPAMTQEVFMAEVAHMVDFFYVTAPQRQDIFDLFHGGNDVMGQPDTAEHSHGMGWFEETGNDNYWDWVGESFMGGFTQAYTNIVPTMTGFTHQLTEDSAWGLRSILTPELDVVAPVEPPPVPDSHDDHDHDHEPVVEEPPTPEEPPVVEEPQPPVVEEPAVTPDTQTPEPPATPELPVPDVPAPKGPGKVYSVKNSKVFHDSHRSIKFTREWSHKGLAVADGQRPCKVCRP